MKRNQTLKSSKKRNSAHDKKKKYRPMEGLRHLLKEAEGRAAFDHSLRALPYGEYEKLSEAMQDLKSSDPAHPLNGVIGEAVLKKMVAKVYPPCALDFYYVSAWDNPFASLNIAHNEPHFMTVLKKIAEAYAKACCVANLKIHDFMEHGAAILTTELQKVHAYKPDEFTWDPKAVSKDANFAQSVVNHGKELDAVGCSHNLIVNVDDAEALKDLMEFRKRFGETASAYTIKDHQKDILTSIIGKALVTKLYPSNSAVQWDLWPSLQDLKGRVEDLDVMLKCWITDRREFEVRVHSVLLRVYVRSWQIATSTLLSYSSCFEDIVSESLWCQMRAYLTFHEHQSS
jgi:hypothetical protein